MNRLVLSQPKYPGKITGVPLSSLYLAAALEGTNVDVTFYDPNIYKNPDEQLKKLIQKFKPTHFGISSFSPSYPEAIALFKKVKHLDPTIITISGGAHEIGTKNSKLKQKSIDIRVTDTFGENALLKILDQDKRIIDRTSLFPRYDLLQEHVNYEFHPILTKGKKSTEINSATGCSGICDMCSVPKGYTPFPIEQVIKNQKKLQELGYGFVFFNDPNFTNPLNQKEMKKKNTIDKYLRTKDLMKSMINEKLSIIWGCQTNANYMNEELLDLMKKAGCNYICYAVENVDKATLQMLRKGTTPDQVSTIIKLTNEKGIKTGLYTMLGTRNDPEKNFEITCKTFNFIESVKPDILSISVLARYPKVNRLNVLEQQNTELDYLNVKYSREIEWLNFDEGYGAYHPFYDLSQLRKASAELDRRKQLNPILWEKIHQM